MKLGVFAYNFNHWKTQQGILNLCVAGFKPSVILAANPVKLNFYKSKIRTAPKDVFLNHPKDLAKHFGIDYKVVIHNSEETADIVKKYDLDVGVILGARILKPQAFENFKLGVINMHPGILPENRGLDTIKWAIVKNIPQGVTSHLIDKNIDRGKMLMTEEIKVYTDDTLIDLHMRIQSLEQKLMLGSLTYLQKNGANNLKKLPKGDYHKSMPMDIESTLIDKFNNYKKNNSYRTEN